MWSREQCRFFNWSRATIQVNCCVCRLLFRLCTSFCIVLTFVACFDVIDGGGGRTMVHVPYDIDVSHRLVGLLCLCSIFSPSQCAALCFHILPRTQFMANCELAAHLKVYTRVNAKLASSIHFLFYAANTAQPILVLLPPRQFSRFILICNFQTMRTKSNLIWSLIDKCKIYSSIRWQCSAAVCVPHSVRWWCGW